MQKTARRIPDRPTTAPEWVISVTSDPNAWLGIRLCIPSLQTEEVVARVWETAYLHGSRSGPSVNEWDGDGLRLVWGFGDDAHYAAFPCGNDVRLALMHEGSWKRSKDVGRIGSEDARHPRPLVVVPQKKAGS